MLGRVAVGRGGWLTLRPGPAVLAGAAGGAVRRVRAGAGGPSRSRQQREAPQRSRWPGRGSAAAPSPCGARGRALRPSVIRRPPAGLASVAGLGQRRPTVVAHVLLLLCEAGLLLRSPRAQLLATLVWAHRTLSRFCSIPLSLTSTPRFGQAASQAIIFSASPSFLERNVLAASCIFPAWPCGAAEPSSRSPGPFQQRVTCRSCRLGVQGVIGTRGHLGATAS